MTDLSKDDVRAMGKAVSLDIGDQDLAEVTEVLNAIIESIDEINPPGLETVEPLPIILPEEEGLAWKRKTYPFSPQRSFRSG